MNYNIKIRIYEFLIKFFECKNIHYTLALFIYILIWPLIVAAMTIVVFAVLLIGIVNPNYLEGLKNYEKTRSK